MDDHPPILFLDIDDVLCMTRPYGRLHVESAVRGRTPDPKPMYAGLLTAEAKAALAQIDTAFGGRLRYVISSSWRLAFDRPRMLTIFREAGLPFVAERLEEGACWCTCVGDGDRAAELALWLERHHRGEPYAAVDDSFSGFHLLEAVARAEPYIVDRLVVCEPGVGLLQRHVPEIVAALQRTGDGR